MTVTPHTDTTRGCPTLAIRIGNQMRATLKTVADRLDSGPSSDSLERTGRTAWTNEMALRSRWRRFESCRGRSLFSQFRAVFLVCSPGLPVPKKRSAPGSTRSPTSKWPWLATGPRVGLSGQQGGREALQTLAALAQLESTPSSNIEVGETERCERVNSSSTSFSTTSFKGFPGEMMTPVRAAPISSAMSETSLPVCRERNWQTGLA